MSPAVEHRSVLEAKGIPLVAVWWVDTVFRLEVTPAKDHRPCPVVTVGFVLEDLPDRVTIISELFSDGDTRQSTSIPRGVIKQIRTVGHVKAPAFVKKWHRERGPQE